MKKNLRNQIVPGWCMTFAQKDLYFSLLAKAQRQNGWSKEETEQQRQGAHIRAFGFVKSRKEINHTRDFDNIKLQLEALIDPANLNKALRTERQPTNRLQHFIKIEQMKMLAVVLSQTIRSDWHNAEFYAAHPELAPAEAFDPDLEAAYSYMTQVMQDRFHTSDIREISEHPNPTRADDKSDLECLRDTIAVRINDLRNKRSRPDMKAGECGWSIHDVKVAAGVECDCAQCCKQRRRQMAQPQEVAA